MKIMIVNGGFLPAKNYGGPVVSIENIVNFMDDDFWIVTRDHDWKDEKKLSGISSGWNQFNDHTKVIYLSDSEHSINRYRDIIREIQPEVIYINGFYLAQMYVPMIQAAQKASIPLLIAPRGTLNKNAMSLKSFKKYAYVAYMRMLIDKKKTYFQSTSEEETERIGQLLGAKSDHIINVENVPSMPKCSYGHPQKEKGSLKCCFFARICEKKNLLGAIRVLKEVKGNVEFNIYGNKEEADYWEKCEREIAELPSNIHVEYRGAYDHSTVFELMAKNHVFLFPTLSENYGHVIVEAMLSGLPIIISDQTPWNDVNDCNVGHAIPLDKVDKYSNAIESYIQMNEQELEILRGRLSQYIQEKLNLGKIKKEYISMFQNIAG